MTRVSDSQSATDDVLDGIDLRGKRVFVTGVLTGLGLETASALAARGANVVGAARKVGSREHEITEAARQGGGSFYRVVIDRADLTSVRSAAGSMVAAGEPLDLVIANAGTMAPPFGHTKDGFELQFGTNFVGHFVLANELSPLMHERARLIVLSPNAHRMADIDLDDPNFTQTSYDPWAAYGRSKTADTLLAVAFDARNKARGVRAASVHPGVIQTELVRHLDPADFHTAFTVMSEHHLALGNSPFIPKTVQQGATTVWAGVVADADTVGGRYCEDCTIGQLLEDAKVSAFLPGVLAYAIASERAEALCEKPMHSSASDTKQSTPYQDGNSR